MMPEITEKGPKEPYKILLVEDTDDDAFLFERALARVNGFQVIRCVHDGYAAIAYLKGEGEFADRERFPAPDIVMLDLKLPGSDGFEVLQWAQRRADRPVLAVFSTYDGESERKRVQQLGADIFETKMWEAPVFERFLHFAGKIADIKVRPEKPQSS
jgi:DNA-binding response OmpR family regulator